MPGPSPTPISTASSTTSACCRPSSAEDSPELASYLQRMRQIGRRTGELQSALASRPDIAGFAPEPIAPKDMAAWTERLLERSAHTLRSAGREARQA